LVGAVGHAYRLKYGRVWCDQYTVLNRCGSNS
jgi:hypothetical protein